jgi:SRSO17 transposase
LGKIANCQQGVFLVYASARGHAFLDAQLYLPEEWFTQAYQARWQACRIPAEQPFRTEPQIALDMITQVVQRVVVPFRWVTADETYGKSPTFLDGIEQLGQWFLVEVPTDTRVWLRTPAIESPGPGLLGRPRTRPRVVRTAAAPREVRALAAEIPQSKWTRRMIKEGSKGPLMAEFAFLRATTLRDKLPDRRVWVVFRRTLDRTRELKVYFSNALATCPQRDLIGVSGLRWPVETALEAGKGEVGMDHYETRTWPAWLRHMAHAALAHLFLVDLCLQWQKKPGPDRAPGPPGDRAGHRRGCPPLTRRARHRPPSAAPQSRGLSFASQAYPATASAPC